MAAPTADWEYQSAPADVTLRPYTPDGAFQTEGLALTAAVGAATGLVAGVVFGVVGQWFYVVLAFPIMIGFAVGFAQKFVIQRTKLRNTFACGAVGLLAGIAAVVAMHYVDYEAFKYYRGQTAAGIEVGRQAVQAGLMTQAEFDNAMREYNADPEVQAMRAVHSFLAYVDWAAQQGVELTSSRSLSGSTNLGYAGTYAYWSVEALVIAALAVGITRTQASQPFCVACNCWKESVEIGRLAANAKQVGAVFKSGRLSRLAELASARYQTAITAYICAQCQNADDVVLQVHDVTHNQQGKEVLTDGGRFVCDSAALDQITALFDKDEAEEPVDEVTAQLLAAANAAYTS